MDDENTLIPGAEGNRTPGQEEKQEQKNAGEGGELKYTDADVDALVAKKFAKLKSELEKKDQEKADAVEEAKKLAKMNANEKDAYELEKLKKENAQLKEAQAFASMCKEATTMLAEAGFTANERILNMVVKDDAEGTKANVDAFAELVNELVESKVTEKLKGEPPKVTPTGGSTGTKTPGDLNQNRIIK